MGCFRMLQRGGGSPFSLEREQVKILVRIQNDLAKQGSFQESLLTAQMINAKMLETFSKILIERSKSWGETDYGSAKLYMEKNETNMTNMTRSNSMDRIENNNGTAASPNPQDAPNEWDKQYFIPT